MLFRNLKFFYDSKKYDSKKADSKEAEKTEERYTTKIQTCGIFKKRLKIAITPIKKLGKTGIWKNQKKIYLQGSFNPVKDCEVVAFKDCEQAVINPTVALLKEVKKNISDISSERKKKHPLTAILKAPFKLVYNIANVFTFGKLKQKVGYRHSKYKLKHCKSLLSAIPSSFLRYNEVCQAYEDLLNEYGNRLNIKTMSKKTNSRNAEKIDKKLDKRGSNLIEKYYSPRIYANKNYLQDYSKMNNVYKFELSKWEETLANEKITFDKTSKDFTASI